ncbi:hypothetical protein [Synechococcus sp. CCY 9618]|uniref:hypothetical protein n=1 Tax=Synechococcus sp. CCY 9618 TaxID=2815602 RepID=UPI001C21A521|nr:hypothetical protein [Synechococcus sp. CCY 9618]
MAIPWAGVPGGGEGRSITPGRLLPCPPWCHRLLALRRREPAWGQDLAITPMLRIRGDRTSLLAALAAHWADQQLNLPQTSPRTPFSPAPQRRRTDRGPAR